MDEDKKKMILVIAVIACIATAGVITYATRSNKSTGIEGLKGQSVWIKCRNPKCLAEYQMDKKEYYEYMQQNMDMAMTSVPALTCKECSEKSAYLATKCSECGLVFEENHSNPRDFPDRCPKCKHSDMEERRKNRK